MLRSGVIVVINLWFEREICKNLEFEAKKVFEYYKQSLIGHCGGNLVNKNEERNVYREVLAHEVSEGNKDSQELDEEPFL